MPTVNIRSIFSLTTSFTAGAVGDAGFTAGMPVAKVGADGVDLRDFPLVRLRQGGALGHAFAWSAAMQGVLARAQPFVLLDQGQGLAEEHADRQARRCWLKAHAAALARYCAGVIVVEPDIAARSRTRAETMLMLGTSALRVIVVSTEAVARQLADVLLKTGERSAHENVARCVGRTIVAGPIDIGAQNAYPLSGVECDR